MKWTLRVFCLACDEEIRPTKNNIGKKRPGTVTSDMCSAERVLSNTRQNLCCGYRELWQAFTVKPASGMK